MAMTKRELVTHLLDLLGATEDPAKVRSIRLRIEPLQSEEDEDRFPSANLDVTTDDDNGVIRDARYPLRFVPES